MRVCISGWIDGRTMYNMKMNRLFTVKARYYCINNLYSCSCLAVWWSKRTVSSDWYILWEHTSSSQYHHRYQPSHCVPVRRVRFIQRLPNGLVPEW